MASGRVRTGMSACRQRRHGKGLRMRPPVLALLALLAAGPALGDADDHDRARAAVAEAGIMPLAQLLPMVEAKLGARVIRVEFEDGEGSYRYEFELIDAAGRLSEVTVDARNGAILPESEGH